MADDAESYIMLLLSDSNLPTGSFVASSGLESYVAHGFAANSPHPTLSFIQDSLPSYARSTLPFASDAHRVVARYFESMGGEADSLLEDTTKKLGELDELYDTMTLNNVAKRASRAQGVALLTLFSKGFSCPLAMEPFISPVARERESTLRRLIDKYKLIVRRGDVPGHLPICWGVITAALGLSLDRTQYLHLFLHARSILSASIRLNDIGPYSAQQLLLHAIRPLLEIETTKHRHLRTGLLDSPGCDFDESTQGPANTWPLGEILSARHDLQHSRIFNS